MELMEYLFNPDQGMWCGYLKGDPEHQVSGESFEALQVKLRQLRLDPCRSSSSSSGSSNTALLCWYWQRRMFLRPQ